MSEESKSISDATPSPLGEIEHGPSKFDQFMEKNMKKLILLALLIVVAVAAFVITSQLKEAKHREAGNALSQAESPADYKKVAADYPGSAASGSAQILMAGQLWEEGKESEAIETLKSLASDSDHPAAMQAKFSLASILLKQGKVEEAKTSYEAIVADSSAKYLHPLSLIALGDIAKAAGEEEKAKEYYQRKIDDYQEYADQGIAVTRLNLVGVDAPEKVSPPPAPEPTAPGAESGMPSSFTTPIAPPVASPVTPPAPAAPAVETPAEETPAESTPPSSPEGETPTFEAPVDETQKEEESSTSETDGDASNETEELGTDAE
ncbi:tetratricopeptide repeat protein [Roseibacillus persicicus]|uniref:tetratricopeptide repeat protein n=1 Tax=Roseibacillus persicicus TaxID=454148 RepID=UPI00398B6261